MKVIAHAEDFSRSRRGQTSIRPKFFSGQTRDNRRRQDRHHAEQQNKFSMRRPL